MTTNLKQSEIVHRLTELRSEHRDLDHAITLLQQDGSADHLAIRRMKKRKLLLKDTITQLQSMLIPDLDA